MIQSSEYRQKLSSFIQAGREKNLKVHCPKKGRALHTASVYPQHFDVGLMRVGTIRVNPGTELFRTAFLLI